MIDTIRDWIMRRFGDQGVIDSEERLMKKLEKARQVNQRIRKKWNLDACLWKEDESDYYWLTSCGYISSEGPSAYERCPYCERNIKHEGQQ